jgi:hypothetical protein
MNNTFMIVQNFSGKILLLASLLLGGCFRPAIPISRGPVYPIDVFFENQTKPDRPYTELQWVELSNEETLTDRQKRSSERLLYRGNDAETKELLTAQLVLKAQRLGADALMNVQYKYFTTATTEGYLLRGMAIEYRGD